MGSGINWINFVSLFFLVLQIQSLNGFSTDYYVDGATFDFIVVGGGTAGNVVASRLAESGRHSVLLIEAGGLPNPILDIPAFGPVASTDLSNVKIYPIVPQRQASLSTNGNMNFTRGQMLGGSSGINAMVLNRGSPHDYDNWARLTSDDSWKYANLLKYFKKYETYSGPYPSDQRGFNGPITVERPRYAPGLAEWLQAGAELGFPIAEPNGPQIISFTDSDFTHKWGRRASSYHAYIEPMLESTSPLISSRRNLKILINSEVKRILFNGNRAIGVKFTSNSGHLGIARARKEVIISAGVVDSAVLLMKSGIGPKSVLDSAHVPAIKYLPVGKNLHDHVTSTLTIVFGNRSAAFDLNAELTPAAWKIFNDFGDGPYASYQGQSGQAFLGSPALSPFERNLGWPDTQLINMNSNSEGGVLGGGVTVTDLEDLEFPVRWATMVGRPKSRGQITLNPTNIDGPPLIDFRYLTHPDDVKVLVFGIKTNLKVCEETLAFQGIKCRVPTDRVAQCSHLPFRSDSYWECYVRHITAFGYHAVGTCRMGRVDDPEAVVDSQLRVIGVNRLRVVDASVMPAVTNTNTQGPTYLIAEKAADMILNRQHSWKFSLTHKPPKTYKFA